MKISVKQIENKISRLQKVLERAEKYVERGINVEGSHPLHLGDWSGNSGHPEWMKNHMIPATKRMIAEQEKVLKRLRAEGKDRHITERRNASQNNES
jgi:hypothetical protein